MSLESVLHMSLRTPTSRANDNPARMASYSAWLLEVLKAKCRDCSRVCWRSLTTSSRHWALMRPCGS